MKSTCYVDASLKPLSGLIHKYRMHIHSKYIGILYYSYLCIKLPQTTFPIRKKIRQEIKLPPNIMIYVYNNLAWPILTYDNDV